MKFNFTSSENTSFGTTDALEAPTQDIGAQQPSSLATTSKKCQKRAHEQVNFHIHRPTTPHHRTCSTALNKKPYSNSVMQCSRGKIRKLGVSLSAIKVGRKKPPNSKLEMNALQIKNAVFCRESSCSHDKKKKERKKKKGKGGS